MIRISRRHVLKTAALTTLSAPLARLANGQTAVQPASRHASQMHLGIVTYNIAKDWSIDTIIKHCEEAGLEGVELRTTHAHGVEVNLNSAQRQEVKKRFQDSKLKLMGLGSAFEYHMPDP